MLPNIYPRIKEKIPHAGNTRPFCMVKVQKKHENGQIRKETEQTKEGQRQARMMKEQQQVKSCNGQEKQGQRHSQAERNKGAELLNVTVMQSCDCSKFGLVYVKSWDMYTQIGKVINFYCLYTLFLNIFCALFFAKFLKVKF